MTPEARQLPRPAGSAGRIPPHNLEAEAAVLSAVMLERSRLDEVTGALEPEHFYSTANAQIFRACIELASKLQPVDVVSVAAWLRDRQLIQKVGGARYLTQLVDATPAVAHVSKHADIVRNKWRVREAIALCQRAAAEGYGDVGDEQQWLDGVEGRLHNVARASVATPHTALGGALEKVIGKLRRLSDEGRTMLGVPTGYRDLDNLLCGLHRGQLVVIAARPGMGKSTLASNIGVRLADVELDGEGRVSHPGYGVVFFSHEMGEEEIASRIICADASISGGAINHVRLSQDDWARILSLHRAFQTTPFLIDDTPSLSVLEMRGRVRRHRAELASRNPPIDLLAVFVDYLQLMKGEKGEGREREVSSIANGLKSMAKELDVVVIALAQLNRGLENRSDKRPMLSDLRESGAIEQDADTVIFIYRDEIYNKNTSDAGLAELLIRKQRNGPTGMVKLRYVREQFRFETLRGSVHVEGE